MQGQRDIDRVRDGTRVRLFPQPPFLKGFREPTTVTLSPPAGSVRAGPSDARMYVIDPIGKRMPYGINRGPYGRPYLYLPPWEGPVRAPARPDAEGHFDHVRLGTREFESAHLYGCARFVMDVWEGYLDRPIKWHFERDYGRLELSVLGNFKNAQAGYGFLQVGEFASEGGETKPFSLNFDVIAHEIGHLMIFSDFGVPAGQQETVEFSAFHESAADIVALIAAGHFGQVIDDLLESTRGNLYVLNEFNRIGELSGNRQIRNASNTVKMTEFGPGRIDEHDLSLPLTGAVFDIFVDIFHELLATRRIISPGLEDLADRVERERESGLADFLQGQFDEEYARDPRAFREALCDARDCVGRYLAETWARLSSKGFSYDRAGRALLAVDRDLGQGCYRRIIERSLRWRCIGDVSVNALGGRSRGSSHMQSARTVLPSDQAQLPRLSYREKWEIARYH